MAGRRHGRPPESIRMPRVPCNLENPETLPMQEGGSPTEPENGNGAYVADHRLQSIRAVRAASVPCTTPCAGSALRPDHLQSPISEHSKLPRRPGDR